MFGLLSLVPSGFKTALYVAVGAAFLGLFFLYTDARDSRNEALMRIGQLDIAAAVQTETIKQQKEALDIWKTREQEIQALLGNLASAQLEATKEARKLNDVLSKHDLHALSLAKPGLIEPRINSGTSDILGLFERATAPRSTDSPGGNP